MRDRTKSVMSTAEMGISPISGFKSGPMSAMGVSREEASATASEANDGKLKC